MKEKSDFFTKPVFFHELRARGVCGDSLDYILYDKNKNSSEKNFFHDEKNIFDDEKHIFSKKISKIFENFEILKNDDFSKIFKIFEIFEKKNDFFSTHDFFSEEILSFIGIPQ